MHRTRDAEALSWRSTAGGSATKSSAWQWLDKALLSCSIIRSSLASVHAVCKLILCCRASLRARCKDAGYSCAPKYIWNCCRHGTSSREILLGQLRFSIAKFDLGVTQERQMLPLPHSDLRKLSESQELANKRARLLDAEYEIDVQRKR